MGRTLLVLGRVSNLPTVWSNVLAGWILGGGGAPATALHVALGISLIYVGGMFLNDAMDEAFDRQHRPERPIPSGHILSQVVWAWALAALTTGLWILSLLGPLVFILSLLLVATVVAYDLHHKEVVWSPVVMSLCRFWVYLIAAGATGYLTGYAFWGALVLAAYVAGLSYVARHESLGGWVRYWPVILMASPIVLSAVVNQGPTFLQGAIFSLLLLGWTGYSLLHLYQPSPPRFGEAVSGLLAGIVWVDALVVLGGGLTLTPAFLLLFLLARLFQRSIPAT